MHTDKRATLQQTKISKQKPEMHIRKEKPVEKAIFNRIREVETKLYSKTLCLSTRIRTRNCPNSTQYADDDVVKSSMLIVAEKRLASDQNWCIAQNLTRHSRRRMECDGERS